MESRTSTRLEIKTPVGIEIVIPPTPVLPKEELGNVLFGHRVHRVGATFDFQRHFRHTFNRARRSSTTFLRLRFSNITPRLISEPDYSRFYRFELLLNPEPREIIHLSVCS